MKLYHYTSLNSFAKIWVSKKLRFSETKNVNDIFERNKIMSPTGATFSKEQLENPDEAFTRFANKFWSLLYTYKQISFAMDFSDALKGYASPMMWAHYADNMNGVCIELDSENLSLPDNCFADKILYQDKLVEMNLDGYDFTKDDITTFINKNRKNIFFTKHSHWEHENEYRIISNNDFLDISDVITKIYVPFNEGIDLDVIRNIIHDDEKISVFRYAYNGNMVFLPLVHKKHLFNI